MVGTSYCFVRRIHESMCRGGPGWPEKAHSMHSAERPCGDGAFGSSPDLLPRHTSSRPGPLAFTIRNETTRLGSDDLDSDSVNNKKDGNAMQKLTSLIIVLLGIRNVQNGNDALPG